ncbi:MAG: 23S rRNA (guanosine(2251)-2'-O)-methyltransferase RlmB [Firmicutes bacterium]|nr:23S rRNA (guanosine(2251)-2'-O)-methyltransferase RlmB [Bacillota bacterium]
MPRSTHGRQPESVNSITLNSPAPSSPLRLEGRNAVLEALNHGLPVDKLLIRKDDGAPSGAASGTLRVIAAKARERGVVVAEVSKAKLDELSGGGNHQGVIALCPAKEYVEPEDILAAARERGEDPFVAVLDGITDPHNLGAIIRSAEAAGAHGIILPKRRAAGLTDVVVRTSAGAIEHMPVSKVTNLVAALEWLKKNGLWIACADVNGRPMYEADLSGPLAIVIGSEGEGAGRLVRERSDFSVRIPMLGKIASLNASVAAGVLFYEAVRQRNLKRHDLT